MLDVAAVRLALTVASRLPVERLHRFAHDIVPTLQRAYRPRVVAHNLAYAFPDADTEALAQDFYAGFGEVCVEVLRALSMERSELTARVTFEGAEALADRSALLLMAHHGNMIWATCALACAIDLPVSIVYKLPHVRAMREALVTIAARFGVTLVPVREVRQRLVKNRHRPQVWTVVADQRPGRDRQSARLCGRETAFFAGPERLARALRWPVYYLSCERTAPARYVGRIVKLAEPPYGAEGPSILDRYVECLQADIDRAPQDWLWSHDRWRDSHVADVGPGRQRR